jgi:hypothetical protein
LADLTVDFGRGFTYVNLRQMRRFYLAWPRVRILQTLSEKFTEASKKREQRDERTFEDCRQAAEDSLELAPQSILIAKTL